MILILGIFHCFAFSMTILFLGKPKTEKVLSNRYSYQEDRVSGLSKLLSEQGHTVIRHISIRKGLGALWSLQPAVVHLHGWGLVSWCWLLALISPQSTLVWTIDYIPRRVPRWVLYIIGYQAVLLCDAITTPSRTIQYTLRTIHGLSVAYVPDGYTMYKTPSIPAKHFNLVPQKYCLVLADNATSLKVVLDAYKATKSSRKLVIFHDKTPAAQRLQTKYPFLYIVSRPYPRATNSLLKQALVVIFADSTPQTTLLLQAMSAGTSVISTTVPLHQEILGVTGQYYKSGDTVGLTQALQKALKSPIKRQAWGLTAKLRASHHFTWERVLADYMPYYSSIRTSVTLDSIRPIIYSLPAKGK